MHEDVAGGLRQHHAVGQPVRQRDAEGYAHLAGQWPRFGLVPGLDGEAHLNDLLAAGLILAELRLLDAQKLDRQGCRGERHRTRLGCIHNQVDISSQYLASSKGDLIVRKLDLNLSELRVERVRIVDDQSANHLVIGGHLPDGRWSSPAAASSHRTDHRDRRRGKQHR